MTSEIKSMSRLSICVSLLALTAVGTPALAKAQDIGSQKLTVPSESAADIGLRNVDVILYDAETIARVNADRKVADSSQVNVSTNRVVDTSVEVDGSVGKAISDQVPSVTPSKQTVSEASIIDQAPRAISQTDATAVTVSMPQKPPARKPASKFPRDISNQYTSLAAGVPIIENPKTCATDQLDVDITVTNVSDSKGTIVADLHNDVEEDFLQGDRVLLRVRMPATEGETKFCMPLTQPGDYAIAIYHDKNNNAKFDKNFLGLPKERFGMSRDPKFGTRSPELQETIFNVPDTGKEISITMFSTGDILGGR